MKTKKLLLGTALLMTLVGCGNASSSHSQEISSSVSSIQEQRNWADALQDLMREHLNTVLPYLRFEQEENLQYLYDASQDCICIFAEKEPDHCAEYGALLTAAGYVSEGSDDSYGYDMFFYSLGQENGNQLVVQVDYFPGEENYAPGFEIFAWIEEPIEAISAWSEEDRALFTEHLGEELPFYGFSTSYSVDYDEEYDMIEISDSNGSSDMLSEYGDLLIENGFTYDENDDTYYKDCSTDTSKQIAVYFFDLSAFGFGIGIYASVETKYTPVSAWPKEELDHYLNSVDATASVPSFTGGSDFAYRIEKESFDISLSCTDEEFDNFYTALGKEGYCFSSDGFGYVYYALSWDDELEIMIGFGEGELDLSVYAVSPSYLALSETFPETELADFAGGTTSIPAFAATEYKIYGVDDYGDYAIVARDQGTIGTDAIEDLYKAALETAGWTVDDTDYDSYGYIATSPSGDITVDFYTENYIFYFWAMNSAE